jgi:hypothetical protein
MMFVTCPVDSVLISLPQENIMDYKLHNDDCVSVLRSYPDNYFDSIVADPPAGISFMGKDWDHDKGGRNAWIAWMATVALECLRTLKPGGHAAIWALPRTSHWVATAWEDAGFEVRDRISHVFGSGFPKSYNVAKGIEGLVRTGSANWSDWKELGGEEYEQKTGYVKKQAEQGYRNDYSEKVSKDVDLTTDEAKQWNGWGTALKPAMEDWWLFRKPISEKTVAANVLKWGTGALNIDASRIELDGEIIPINKLPEWSGFGQTKKPEYNQEINTKGRWPANFIHDGSDEVVNLFPPAGGQQAPTRGDGTKKNNSIFNDGWKHETISYLPRTDSGSAARFFYCAKPDKTERNEGLNGDEETEVGHNRFDKCGTCGGYIFQNKNRPSACRCENPVRLKNTI